MTVVNVSSVKAVNSGGRLFTGVDAANVRYNGELGFLGNYVAGSTQVKEFVARNQATHPNEMMPMIIMQPEMMYDNSRMSLNKLNNFSIPIGENFTCIPLEEGDKFDVTADLLFKSNGDAADGADFEIGKCYVLENGQTKLRLTASGGGLPTPVGRVYFKIVKVKDAHSRSARVGGAFAKDNYKLYTLEVYRNHP